MTATTLFTEAAAGRGLWIGLFPAIDEDLSTLVDGYLPTDPHCTLVHLGKSVSDYTVEQAVRASSIASLERVDVLAAVGGVARFRGSDAEGDPIVALLQHAGIRALRTRLVELLDDVLVPQTFDYTPHVTLRRCPRGVLESIAGVQKRVVRFSRVGVVCGDARLFLAMRPA